MLHVQIARCACGLKVRAMASDECVVARLDKVAWRGLCAEKDRIDRPMHCRELLSAMAEQGWVDLLAQTRAANWYRRRRGTEGDGGESC